MVNHGVSRACAQCKQRRKKCDETLPTCNRCNRAGLSCSGPSTNGIVWRHYATHARLPTHSLYSEEIENQKAAEIFLTDFADSPAEITGGFFHGFERLLGRVGSSPSLSQAASLVVLANLGNRLRRPELKIEASRRYSRLLSSLASFQSRRNELVLDQMTTAALLDIYEIITTDDSGSMGHGIHTRGTAAILSRQKSLTEMTSELQVFQRANALFLQGPLVLTNESKVTCAPSSSPPAQGLDYVLLRWNEFVERARSLSDTSEEGHLQAICELLSDGAVLDQGFQDWATGLEESWSPIEVGMVDPATVLASGHPCLYSGRLDTYTNLYVSTVWNTSRKAHLMLLQIMHHCALRLSNLSFANSIQNRASDIAADLASSVPFHLLRDVQDVLHNHSRSEIRPQTIAGGMLIMHPLFVAANCSVLPRELRSYFKHCLIWIGTHMGIGQAFWMAQHCINTSEDNSMAFGSNEERHARPQRTAEGHTIYWSGLLAT